MSAPLVSICLLDEDGSPLVEEHADEVHYAASIMKLPLMVAAERALEADPGLAAATFDPAREVRSRATGEPVVIDEEDRDHDLLASGPATIEALVERAITVSSNTATNLLLDVLGTGAVDRVWRDLDADGCRVGRLLWDFGAPESARNTITARGVARLLHAVRTGTLASPDSSARMVEVLRRQTHRDMISAVCPPGTVVGSKDGEVSGVRHDAAHLSKDGRECYVSILTTSELSTPDAEELIRQEARRVLADWFAAR